MIFLAVASARTLNPKIVAREVSASIASDSLIPPTPVPMISALTSLVPISLIACVMASREPRTSVLRTMRRTFFSPSCIVANMFSILVA